MRGVEAGQGLGRQVVVTTRLNGRLPAMQAGERERVITERADVVLRLPDAAPLDACARVQRIDDAPAEDLGRNGWRRNEERRLAGRGPLALVRGRLAEEKLKPRPSR